MRAIPRMLWTVAALAVTLTAGSRLRAELLQRMTGRPLPLARLTAREQRALVSILERLLDESAT